MTPVVEQQLKTTGNSETFHKRTIGALVMDADYRALGVVRSLGAQGIPVWVMHHGDQMLATLSRYAKRVIAWRTQQEDGCIDCLLELAHRDLRGWLLIPTGDESAAMVARNHGALKECFRLTTPSWKAYQQAYDKRLAYQLADSLGISHPCTASPLSREEVIAGCYTYPVILKPAYRTQMNRFTAAKAWRADGLEELVARYDDACTLVDPRTLMIQELVPGGGESQFSHTALSDDGEIVASLTARRTRQIPMDFGRASTFVETIDDPGISEMASRLIRALNYTGILEIEFKRDQRDGKFKLLDINSRVWGWQSLCGAAGVDFPYLLWLVMTGQPVPPTTAVSGVRWVRMSTDAPTALREILRGHLSLLEYLWSMRPPLAPAIFAFSDPLPGILELPLGAYLFFKRAIRGGRIS